MSSTWEEEKYARLTELIASAFQVGEKRVREKERKGFVSVLDDAQEAHAAFAAVAGLAECARDDQGISVRGHELAALLRVVNARLERAIDVASAAAAGESGAVVFMRE
ncbi:MAG: hypothetical protein PHI64_19465 [Zoogloea sp.]|uniref:hypothetical protein n=1 Tax=Zoogloea sp. TaxID=49181 RepID=UPI002620329B|nr:hypothetical protein [Zoogloea sp.]MDD2991119.1 hypothetical protein [Zoogloea sp.]